MTGHSNPAVRQFLISGGLEERRSAIEHLAMTTRMNPTQAAHHLDNMRRVLLDARDFAHEVRVYEVREALVALLDGRPTDRLRKYEERPQDVLLGPVERIVAWLARKLG
jgi:hypothetical protein